MTPEEIAKDTERGIAIKKQMSLLEKELKEIETRLQAAGADGEQIPLQDQNREGKQFLARSPYHILPVRFESDLIAGSFEPHSIMHEAVLEAAGVHFPRFYKPSNKFERKPKDGETFRKLARQLLAPDAFARLIRAATSVDKDGIAKSKIVVAWDDAKTIAASTTP